MFKPHIHAIVDADEVGEAEWQELSALVVNYLRAALGPDLVQPNVYIKPINTPQILSDHIGYMLKPVNIISAYQKAWPRASLHHCHLAQQLNSKATDH